MQRKTILEMKQELSHGKKLVIGWGIACISSWIIFYGGLNLIKESIQGITPEIKTYQKDKDLSNRLDIAISSLTELKESSQTTSEKEVISEALVKLEKLMTEVSRRILASRNEYEPLLEASHLKESLGSNIVAIGGTFGIISFGITLIFILLQLSKYVILKAHTRKVNNHLSSGQD